MTVLVSDLHLGRGTPAETRAADRDAAAMIRAHGLTAQDTLVLLGDVFDQFIEYRHLVPKGAPRLGGAVAELTDAGVRVLYAVGNRDPWHETFVERELGATLLRRPTRVEADGHGVYLAHGDLHVRSARRGAAASSFHPLLRAPLMARLYRMALPGDAAFALARWVARRFGSDGAPTDPEAAVLHEAARTLLARSDVDVVAFGHVHRAALARLPGGAYLNPGYWFGDRTFARLDAAGPALFRWAHGAAVPFS